MWRKNIRNKMTRINLVPPEELSDQHLLAEMRELPRVFTHVRKHGLKVNKISEEFTLGKGHVLFFTNKLKFLMERYFLLVNEWENRGFNWFYDKEFFYKKNYDLLNVGVEWSPNQKDIELSRQKLQEKIAQKPNYYKWTILK
ncbi:MAG: pyrimidine dimer DNA glycosylase/endonuclease V [Candidatus Woesearchaeota archaeon]